VVRVSQAASVLPRGGQSQWELAVALALAALAFPVSHPRQDVYLGLYYFAYLLAFWLLRTELLL
jgi:hypothetical protein